MQKCTYLCRIEAFTAVLRLLLTVKIHFRSHFYAEIIIYNEKNVCMYKKEKAA